MERIDTSTQAKNLKIKKGTILLLQGERNKSINFLHSGLAELLSNSSPASSSSPDDLITGSRRVGLVKGESIYGILSIKSDEPHSKTTRALTDCIISVIPISDEGIMAKMLGDIRLNLRILRALVQRIDSGRFIMTNYKNLWKNLISTAGSLALGAQVNPDNIGGNKVLLNNTLSFPGYIKRVKKRLKDKKIKEPEDWDPNVFLGKKQEELGLFAEVDDISVETLIDEKQFLFFKRFLRKEDTLLISLFKKDEPMTFYIYQFLSETLKTVISKNEELANTIYSMVETLFCNNGWIHQIIKGQGLKNKKASVFNHYLSKYCWKYRKDIIQLLGIDLKTRYPVYSNLIYFSKINPLAVESGDNKPGPVGPIIKVDAGIVGKFKNLQNRILEFSYMGDEFNNEFVSNMNKFKQSDKKFENDPKINSLKRRIADQYWKLYEQCFIKVIDSSLTNFIPGIMLHFGVLDETLLTPEELVFIHNAFSKTLYVDSTIPVMTLPYFLEKIYKEEMHPSMTEMGQSFQEVLRKQTRPTKKSKPTDFFHDTAEDRVRFEIEKCISSSYRMIFGSVSTAFPILSSDGMLGSIENLFLEPGDLADRINNLKDRDFSMFHREIVLHLKYGSDIVKKEVLPNLVLYPTFGTKMITWQELDGPKRNTPGRMFLPTFFNGDIDKTLLAAIGNFRWELQRIMAGGSWMDPVNGGLTGAYYDYITFYKKNPNLTSTVKDKLKDFIKRTRSDKDRFTTDYSMWVLNEFEGIPKLNNVVREIFYKYIPFKQKERERLNKRPAFSNLEMKYQNIIKRQILKIETRIRKYEKAGEPVPEDLLEYHKFLKV